MRAPRTPCRRAAPSDQDRFVDPADGVEVAIAGELLARKFDCDELLGHQAVGGHAERDDEHAAKNEQLPARAQNS